MKSKKELIERIHWLDIAKGIGILLMLLGHVGEVYGVQRWIYSFHMPLFFIISGMILKMQEVRVIDRKTKILNLCKNLMYPYYMFSAIYIIYLLIMSVLFHQNNSVEVFLEIKNCFLFYGIGNLWFIPCMYFSQLIFTLVKRKYILGVFSISAIMFSVMYYGNHYKRNDCLW